MQKKKIRGHNRKLRQIELWRQNYLTLDIERLLERQSIYTKIYVHPWSSLNSGNSIIPVPYGKTRQHIVNALLDIHDSWRNQLGKLGQPFYLKIWLFEPRFLTSQVVCALGDRIDYYNDLFYKPDVTKQFHPEDYGKLQNRILQYNWHFGLDEDAHDNSDLGDPGDYASLKEYKASKIWFKRLMKQPHRTEQLEGKIGDIKEVYFFKRGYIWVGGQ